MRAALGKAGLPFDDRAEPDVVLFAFAQDGVVVGYGGLELYGPDALLRSIVVAPDRRRAGFGRGIVEHLLRYATARGVSRIFLLTTDARTYFERCGFRVADRGEAPASIATTRQMAGLCPASATLMLRTFGP